MRTLACTAAFFILMPMAFAQVDPASEILLAPSTTSPDSTGLESGRYKVKKSAQSPAPDDGMTIKLKKVKTLPAKNVSSSETSLNTTGAATTKSSSPSPEVGKLLFSPSNAANGSTSVSQPVTKVVDNGETASVVEPSVTDQVRDLVSGKGSDSVEAYKEQIHPDDIRMNRIEVNIMPGVMTDQSKSSYSFRNYETFSPKLSLGANFWLTPFMGLYADYTTSMGSDVSGDAVTGSRISAQHEWTELGMDVRKFFGMSRRSNSMQYGLHFSEYKFVVPGDDLHRVGLRSTGIGFHLMTRIPTAPSYAWVFGGKLIPRVQHSELGTGVDLSSGSGGESTRVDLILGGEFKMARENQIVWNITSSFEKNQFNGQANTVDPERGTAPQGVSVDNTFLLFSLGYRWGQ
jgi:hypothetical protein